MRVLYVTSEAFPLIKTGGLADVAAGLPAALNTLGIDTRLLLPAYPQAIARASGLRESARLGNLLGCGDARLLSARLPGSEVPVWLLDCPPLFKRGGSPYQDDGGSEWNDNALRFAALNHAAAMIADGRAEASWRPDVVHGQDWHAGLLPILMAGRRATRPATMLTVHNLAYQGLFPVELFGRLGVGHPQAMSALEFHGQLSFLKAGIVLADALTTVSPTYANEILTQDYGCGLDHVLRGRAGHLVGIMNGADYGIWDPVHDPHIAETYSAARLSGKPACKRALQQELGLEESAATPLIVFQSRLAHQKMPDVVLEILPGLLAGDLQFALFADGDESYASRFRELAARFPGRVSVSIGYEEPRAHRMLAGADILLHPSRFEPCGLGPIYAMRYGTLPVVRRTGGMADSVVDTSDHTLRCDVASGFTFDRPTAGDLAACTRRALAMHGTQVAWRRVQACAMRQDFSWTRPALAYADIYRSLVQGFALDRPKPALQRAWSASRITQQGLLVGQPPHGAGAGSGAPNIELGAQFGGTS